MAEELGIEMESTWWQDFTVADAFGESAIKDTFNRAYKYWMDDKVYTTELVMVLNWKIWEWFEKDKKIAKLYESLWRKADGYVMENWKGEDLQYYLRKTD